MAYQIKWDERAFKELKQITSKDAINILNNVNTLYEEPEKKGKSLQGKFKGKFRIRIGDYRAIYWIEENIKIVWIISVKHRKDIYKIER